jgi:hypothetical protein
MSLSRYGIMWRRQSPIDLEWSYWQLDSYITDRESLANNHIASCQYHNSKCGIPISRKYKIVKLLIQVIE